jgi:glycogen synthase kinase 3 beta
VVGQGLFGVVYLSHAPDGSEVAIKRVVETPGDSGELDVLRLLDSDYCVRLRTVFRAAAQHPAERYLHFVMDYLPMTLHQFSLSYRRKRKYPPLFFVKLFGYKLFAGLAYIHSLGFVHRDIKPDNILVDPENGDLKICDFGSAHLFAPDDRYVHRTSQRAYRAPELLGERKLLTPAADVWAAGCVLAETLMSSTQLFGASTNEEQFGAIVRTIGNPTSQELHCLIGMRNFTPAQGPLLIESVFPKHAPDDFKDLLKGIFVFDPGNRITAEACADHPFFTDLATFNYKVPGVNTVRTPAQSELGN